MNCRKCNNGSFYLQQKGFQVGFYCETCGTWMKWASKKEQEIYRNRGIKIHPQDAVVELKMRDISSIVQPVSTKYQNIGFEDSSDTVSLEDILLEDNNSQSFGKKPIDMDIEAEIQRRVAEELRKIEGTSDRDSKKNERVENSGSEYCPICDGSPLVAESGSKVEVSIFSGVMTVTDIDGVEILGLYRLKNCPNCGKIF